MKFDKTFIVILTKYSNYSYIFLVKIIIKFSKYTNINYYIIKLKKDKQLFFWLIYILKLIRLDIKNLY